MSSSEVEAIYEQLLERYKQKGISTPETALKTDIERVVWKGRTREEAIRELNSSDSPWTYYPPDRVTVSQQEKMAEQPRSAQIARLREKIDSLTTLFSRNEITEETYLRGVKKIEEDISSLQREHKISPTKTGERTPTIVSRDSAQETEKIVKPSETSKYEEAREDSRLHLLRKYFIHGLAFSLLFLVLGFVWGVVFVFFAVLGGLIGLAIGFGLLFPTIGYANSVITREMWFDVRMEFWDLFVHGVVLFIALLPINLLFLALQLAFPDILVLIVTFLIETIPNGFVASKVAGLWED